MLSEELCEIWQLGTVYNSFISHAKDKLCTYGEMLLRVTRIMVSKVLRDKVVRLAHEGHQWVVQTKYRLQSKEWWPGIEWTKM